MLKSYNYYRQNIKTERVKFSKDKKKFHLQKTYEIGKIESSKSQWDNNIKLNESNNCKEIDILDIDIGGTHRITTSRCTLIKVS